METVTSGFDELWSGLFEIGRGGDGEGHRRLAWTAEDLAARAWFAREAEQRGLALEIDRNGNQWAWWGDPAGEGAVVAGSHLDTVPRAGAFDGALGVVAAFAAVDRLCRGGFEPARPLAVVSFVEEEGARFGAACLGSRLLTGALAPEAALALTDSGGVTLDQALRTAGLAPERLGPEPARAQRIAAFLEVHVEQGRFLVHRDAPLGIASEIWPHGRYRLDFDGEANHAGTTLLADRRDPMVAFARTVLAAREAAERRGGLATFGRVHVEPNATNAIPSLLRAWLDARAPDDETVAAIVADVAAAAGLEPRRESWAPAIAFDAGLRALLSDLLAAPELPTAAGHDAGVLAAAGVPAAMLFVRNPSGVSHSPFEHAERDDCLLAVEALAGALERLAR